MKLYTATGDQGQTALFDGTRVSKDCPRVSAYGEVDELNAVLGWCRAACDPAGELSERLRLVQNELFVLGGELATPPDSRQVGSVALVDTEMSQRLEGWIDAAVASAPPLRNFILPGGTELSARLHLARTCCRRAERAVVSLKRLEGVRPEVIVYLNRLGDLLFAWARQVNHEAGVADQIWVSPK